ncbi:hypothetical protein M9H77_02965 [Catharanthus roseus]|uniref:Uncharacterized protein n=1 Tax=Catharanthus roseus TaxID=4058 RepID=A0ACC0CA25_CATRO|nr:hypothetical protein M9H77_02965 [Catharanthus roseus]
MKLKFHAAIQYESLLSVGVNVIIMYRMKSYQREYEEYYEGYDHSAHTHDGSLVLMNFGEPSKNQKGRLGYKSIKIISFFPSNSYLCFEIYFKEIKLFSLLFIKRGNHFTFLNSIGTYLERRYFIKFNYISCAIPRVDDYDFNIANCVSCVLGVVDTRSMKKKLGPILEDLSISLSLNLLLYVMNYKVESKEDRRGNLKKQVWKILKLQNNKGRRRCEPYYPRYGSSCGREESNKPTADSRSTMPSPVGLWPKSFLNPLEAKNYELKN